MNKKIAMVYELILGIPKTIIINFKYLSFFQAIKLPIIISSRCVLKTLHGKINIEGKITTGMIKIGFGNVGIIDSKYCRSILELSSDGVVTFKGNSRMGVGFKLSNNGKLFFGENFVLTGNSTICCNNEIKFGDNCLVSWEVLFLDDDFHEVIKNGRECIKSKPIIIGNNVWIGMRSTILKGTVINSNSVISSNSRVTGKFNETGVIIGGIPAKVICKNISWKK